jgi:pyridoxal biosynthesis lyase PdxS
MNIQKSKGNSPQVSSPVSRSNLVDLWEETKPLAERAPLSLFSRCRAQLRVPTCAIGGITVDNAASLLAAGADMVAVISDLFEAADVQARAAAYQHIFEEDAREIPQSATV